MKSRYMLALPADAREDVLKLSESLGFSPDMAVLYAVRMVNACIEEGLIGDVPGREWPQQVRMQGAEERSDGDNVIDITSVRAGR